MSEQTVSFDVSSRLVAAARNCYRRKGVTNTTMSDIASEAGVVRATLYRYFPSKEAMLLAVFREEVKDFLAEFQHRATPQGSFCRYLLDFMVFCVRYSPEMPLHHAVFSEQSALWVSRTFIGDPEALALVIEPLREPFNRACQNGELRADITLEELSEICTRQLISYQLVPENNGRSDEELSDYFERLFIGGIRA